MSRDEQRAPIEPLSKAAWARVERGIFQELDDSLGTKVSRPARGWPRLWVGLGAAAIVVQLALVALLVWRDREPAPLAGLRLESQQQASTQMLGDIALELEPRTALLVIDDDARGSLCVLEHGAVSFSVPKRGKRPPFVVQAGQVRVEVVGTRFRVERTAASAKVSTFEGTVRVIAAGRTTLVTRGERWPAEPSALPSPQPVGQASDQVGEQATDQTIDQAESTTPPPLRPQSTARQREPSVEAAPEHRHSPRARFEAATALESRDPEQALAIYRGLADSRGPWAQNALYAQARLQLELGRRDAAARALHVYLKRHPSGANAADARALLSRLQSGD